MLQSPQPAAAEHLPPLLHTRRPVRLHLRVQLCECPLASVSGPYLRWCSGAPSPHSLLCRQGTARAPVAASRSAASQPLPTSRRTPLLTRLLGAPQIKFVRGALATPQLLSDIDLPESVSLLGQMVDLRSLRDALAPARRGLQGVVSQVGALYNRPLTCRC